MVNLMENPLTSVQRESVVVASSSDSWSGYSTESNFSDTDAFSLPIMSQGPLTVRSHVVVMHELLKTS